LQYAVGVEGELELGVGEEATPAIAELKGDASFPLVLPPPLLPIPIPTEVALDLGTSHGRGMEICVDLPVELGPRDEGLLMELATDINGHGLLDRGARDFPNRGKFQRRAHRVLNYAKRRVPGIQSRLNSEESLESDADAPDDEFDVMDRSIRNLRGWGLEASANGTGVFRDANVAGFVAAFDEAKDLRDFMNDPDQIFSGLPDQPLRSISCLDLGVTDLRSRIPRLDALCDELALLPSFDVITNSFVIIDGIRDELVAAIAEIGEDFVGDTAEERRTQFCRTTVGMRPAFNRFCGR
jgi:hypothetical protein